MHQANLYMVLLAVAKSPQPVTANQIGWFRFRLISDSRSIRFPSAPDVARVFRQLGKSNLVTETWARTREKVGLLPVDYVQPDPRMLYAVRDIRTIRRWGHKWASQAANAGYLRVSGPLMETDRRRLELTSAGGVDQVRLVNIASFILADGAVTYTLSNFGACQLDEFAQGQRLFVDAANNLRLSKKEFSNDPGELQPEG